MPQTKNSNTNTKVKQAIALKYEGNSAPQVTATGQNEIAEEIIRLAKENNIPIQEDPDLAVLLAQLDLHEQIPESLYFVVAEVLAFTYLAAGKTPNNFKK